jgi:O-antigen/teichoic acid export membrane protein
MRRLPKNFMALFLSDIASRVFGFIATVYVARLLDVAGFGIIGYGMTFLTYALLFANPGLTTIGAREIAKRSSNKEIISDILGLRIACAAVILIICLVACYFIPGASATKRVIMIYLLVLIPHALLLEFVFQGREEMGSIGLSRVLNYGVYLILLCILFRNSDQILQVPIAFLIGYCAASLFLVFVFLLKYRSFNIRFSTHAWRALCTAAIPVGLATIFNQVALNMPVLVLGALHSKTAAGLYYAGFKIVVMLLIVERVSYYLFFPIISRHYTHAPDKLRSTFSFFTRFLFSVTIPIALFGGVYATKIILFIYGSSYYEAVTVFRILLIYFLITPINTIFGYGLIALDREKKFLKVIACTSAGAVVLIIISSIFYGASGAAVALAIAEIAAIFMMYQELRSAVRFPCFRPLIKPFISGIVMIAGLYVIRTWHIGFLCVIAVVIYWAAFYILGGFSRDDLKYLSATLKSKE